MSTSPSVCFVAPNAYASLSGREDLTNSAGAELQQALLAEELVRRGHAVSFIVLDHGQPRDEEIRRVRIFKCYRLDSGIRGVRFFYPRLSGLWRAMRWADADVYYQRCAETTTGLVGQWCRLHGRGFVFATAHDADCMAQLPLISRGYERLLYRNGLRLAHAVVTQTLRQEQMLMAEFGVASTVIRNAFAWRWGSESAAPPSRGRGWRQGILWVGRISEEKRPELVLQLARELTECRFDIVGRCDSAYGRGVVAQIEALPNAQWHGYVPHRRMVPLYRNARVLLCTSSVEGFPNVFLEAWSCGKGIVSTVDPDGVITRFQLGVVASGVEELKRHLLALDDQRAFWESAGVRGRQYVEEHHGVGIAGRALSEVIHRVAVRSRRGRSERPGVPSVDAEGHTVRSGSLR